MANIKAITDGNWSDVNTWDGGAIPGVTDIVWANGHKVALDADVTVAALRNDSANSATVSSTSAFYPAKANLVINASLGSTDDVQGAVVLLITANEPNSVVTINGEVYGVKTPTGNNGQCIDARGDNPQITINGNVWCSRTTQGSVKTIVLVPSSISTTAKLVINGDLKADTTNIQQDIGCGIEVYQNNADFELNGKLPEIPDNYQGNVKTTVLISVSGHHKINSAGQSIDGTRWDGSIISMSCNNSTIEITFAELTTAGSKAIVINGGNNNCIINGDVKAKDNMFSIDVNGNNSSTYTHNGNIIASGTRACVYLNQLKTISINGTLLSLDANVTNANCLLINAQSQSFSLNINKIEWRPEGRKQPCGFINYNDYNKAVVKVLDFIGEFKDPIDKGRLFLKPTSQLTIDDINGHSFILNGANAVAIPTECDVRLGVAYGNNLTGKLKVPPAHLVIKDEAYDCEGAKIGTFTVPECPDNGGGGTGAGMTIISV